MGYVVPGLDYNEYVFRAWKVGTRETCVVREAGEGDVEGLVLQAGGKEGLALHVCAGGTAVVEEDGEGEEGGAEEEEAAMESVLRPFGHFVGKRA